MRTGVAEKSSPATTGLSHEPMRRKRLRAGSVAAGRLRPVARPPVDPFEAFFSLLLLRSKPNTHVEHAVGELCRVGFTPDQIGLLGLPDAAAKTDTPLGRGP